jgi:ribosomal protein S12 methylthiotransferase accessory factor YcaO
MNGSLTNLPVTSAVKPRILSFCASQGKMAYYSR